MINIIIIIFMILFLIISTFSFLQKGPLVSTIYFVSSEKEKRELKSKDRYYFIGIIFLLSAILLGLILIGQVLNIPLIKRVRNMIIIALCIYSIVGYIHLESKRMKNTL